MTRFIPSVLAGALVASSVATSAMADVPRVITVTGTGQVASAPDMATVSTGVIAQAPTAGEALRQMSAQMSAVLETIVGDAGVARKDVQTNQLNLYPRYSERRNGESQEITGFEARSTLTIIVRDLDSLGTVLDRLVSDGANTLDSLSFGVADPQSAQDEARRRAVADARARATLFAEASGVELGPLMSLSEGGHSAPQTMLAARYEMADAVPIAEGEVTLSATVTMVYQID